MEAYIASLDLDPLQVKSIPVKVAPAKQPKDDTKQLEREAKAALMDVEPYLFRSSSKDGLEEDLDEDGDIEDDGETEEEILARALDEARMEHGQRSGKGEEDETEDDILRRVRDQGDTSSPPSTSKQEEARIRQDLSDASQTPNQSSGQTDEPHEPALDFPSLPTTFPTLPTTLPTTLNNEDDDDKEAQEQMNRLLSLSGPSHHPSETPNILPLAPKSEKGKDTIYLGTMMLGITILTLGAVRSMSY